ncbi:MAG: type II TA system antitoxin MqsA family protein [Gemmatimonadaceae bacterium]
MTTETMTCPNCETAAELVRENRLVPLGQRRVLVEDEFLRCNLCGEEFYTPELADQRHRRSIDRARLDDNLLAPGQIRAIRTELGMSQRVFEQILGVGEKTCVRWEQGRVAQNAATDRLIRLIAADRANVQRLASINGVALPDSCFVPTQQDEPGYAEMFGFWAPDPGARRLVREVAIGGNLEASSMDTAEHEAIVSTAGTPVRFTVDATTALGSLPRKGGMLQ